MNGFISQALWNWFWGWPWYAHVGLAVGVGLFLWGALAGLYSVASKLGGWKAGVGALLALGAVLAALWPRKGISTEEQYGRTDPIIVRSRKKGRPTIFDGLRK